MDPCISCYSFLVLCLVRFSTPQAAFNQSALSTYYCPKRTVEVIVSPLVTPTSIRVLQLSWSIQVDVMPGDYVALYSEDATRPEAEPLFSVFVDEKEGWVTSDVHQDKTNYTTLAFSSQCLGYWIAYKNNATNADRSYLAKVLASSCLKTEPRWMEKYQSDIENLALKNVFFPGTHNSGSYLESDGSFHESTFHKYVYTQDETILNQLILGVRYLDLRVGYYPDTEVKWWLNHNVFLVRPLKLILDDVVLFVNKTKEIVILDVHAFPVGFKFNSDKMHAELQNYLTAYLGDNLVPTLPTGWTSTLRSVWNTGRQVILSYNKLIAGRNQIWSPIDQKWGNVQSLKSLQNHVDKLFQRITRHPWAIMAELTPTFVDVVTNRPGGLRKMADAVNRNVTRWFQGNYGKSCNIVAVDFLKNTGLVQSAIDWNRRKGLEINC